LFKLGGRLRKTLISPPTRLRFERDDSLRDPGWTGGQGMLENRFNSRAQKQAKIRIASIATDFYISELIVEIKADRGQYYFLSSRKF